MTLAYETSGRGIPLVLIHAFPLSSSMWKAQINNLAEKNQVITLDLPGFGRSERQSRPDIAQMACDLAQLLDSIGVKEPVVIAGLSMGGYAAFEFFRQFPGRVKALGLFSTRAGSDTPETREKRKLTAEQIKRDGLEGFSKTMALNLLSKTSQTEHPELVRTLIDMIGGNSREGVADALLAMAERRDSTDLLRAIQCPTLIVAGDEDTLIPCSEAEAMQRQIAGSQMQLLPKAGHLVNLEQPEAFQKILKDFLRKF